MASHKLMTTKDGREYYKIRVSRGKGQSPYQTNWYFDRDDYKRRRNKEEAILKDLEAFEIAFEEKCRSGEVMNRAEKAAKAEAERVEAARIEAEEGRIKTFKRFVEEDFLPATKRKNIADNTKAYYTHIAQRSFTDIDDIKLPDITPEQIQRMLYRKLDEGSSQSRVHGMFITLNQLFDMAEDRGLIDRNPMSSKALRKEPRRNKDEEHRLKLDAETGEEKALAYTAKEVALIEKYLGELPESQEHWKIFFELALRTGMRKGEIAALRWSSIDFKNKCIRVAANLQYDSLASTTKIGAPKTESSRREIPLTDAMTNMLKDYYTKQHGGDQGQRDRQIASIEDARSAYHNLIFHQATLPGEPIKPINLSSVNLFARRFEKAHPDIKDFHPHKLRHTFATIAISQGVDVATVSRILGHANSAITLKTYTHWFNNNLRSGVEAFEAGIASNE